MNPDTIFSLIDKMFEENKHFLVDHQLTSYNDFFEKGISQIFKERNPITIMKQQDEQTKEFRLECKLYLGGKDGTKIHYGKPIVYDDILVARAAAMVGDDYEIVARVVVKKVSEATIHFFVCFEDGIFKFLAGLVLAVAAVHVFPVPVLHVVGEIEHEHNEVVQVLR